MARELSLTGKKIALVDDADYERVAQHRWFARRQNHTFYAVRSACRGRSSTTMYLHRFIMDAKPDIEIDHKDGDGLNCQRPNLRVATRSQQNQNQRPRRASGIKGVSCSPQEAHRPKPWRAVIWLHGKKHSLGCFATEESAGRAYDSKARELFGEFAWLNFPENGEQP